MDIHNLPEHWTDTKHEPDGTSFEHLEVDSKVIESRYLPPEDVLEWPIQFVTGENVWNKLLVEEMSKIGPGTVFSLDVDRWGDTSCYDDVSGDVLKVELVREARALEVEYLKRMKVYDIVSRAEMKRSGRGKLIKGRWLDVNKGDSVSPDVRSRYVGKEFATGVDASLYAGTPPLEALKMIVAEAASHKRDGLHIMLSDVKRAYFHASAARELYVEIPREDPEWTPDAIGRLNFALYGTRDAAKLWQECVAKHLVSIGFRRGRSSPCVYYHPKRKLRTLVHGDDYATVGTWASPCHRATISRFKIGFELIKVRVKWVAFTLWMGKM